MNEEIGLYFTKIIAVWDCYFIMWPFRLVALAQMARSGDHVAHCPPAECSTAWLRLWPEIALSFTILKVQTTVCLPQRFSVMEKANARLQKETGKITTKYNIQTIGFVTVIIYVQGYYFEDEICSLKYVYGNRKCFNFLSILLRWHL